MSDTEESPKKPRSDDDEEDEEFQCSFGLKVLAGVFCVGLLVTVAFFAIDAWARPRGVSLADANALIKDPLDVEDALLQLQIDALDDVVKLGSASFGVLSHGLLGAASAFSVLGYTHANATGADTDILPNDSRVGVVASRAIHGFPTKTRKNLEDSFTLAANAAAFNAYYGLRYTPCTANLTATHHSKLQGLTLTEGVYCTSRDTVLNGTLTLNGAGNHNSAWVFVIRSAWTGRASIVVLENGAHAHNVFWVVRDRVDIGPDSSLQGTILSKGSISIGLDSRVDGRLVSIQGGVSIHNTVVSTVNT